MALEWSDDGRIGEFECRRQAFILDPFNNFLECLKTRE